MSDTAQITYKPTESLLNVINNNISKTSEAQIPEVVYADDGSEFFPCKFCCFAYAYKDDQLQHMQICNFKDDASVSSDELPRAKARKSFANSPTSHLQKLGKLPNTKFAKPKPYVNNNPPTTVKVEPEPYLGDIKQLAIMYPKTCLDCGEVFNSKTSLYEHRKEKHPKIYVSSEDLIYYDELFKQTDMNQCTICFKPTNKAQWARHLATHAEEKNFDCSICSRKFRRKDQRNVHEKSHAGAS